MQTLWNVLLCSRLLFSLAFSVNAVESGKCSKIVLNPERPDDIACICNSTVCHQLPVDDSWSYLSMLVMATTSKEGKRFERSTWHFVSKTSDDLRKQLGDTVDGELFVEMGQAKTNVRFEGLRGFGGALTDQTVINVNSLDGPLRDKLIDAYLQKHGLHLDHLRIDVDSKNVESLEEQTACVKSFLKRGRDLRALSFTDGCLKKTNTDKRDVDYELSSSAEFADCFHLRDYDRRADCGSWNEIDKFVRELIQDMKNGTSGWMDFDLADQTVEINTSGEEFYLKPLYYVAAHFSRFLLSKTKLLASRLSPEIPDVDIVAYGESSTNPESLLHRLTIFVRNGQNSDVEVSITDCAGKTVIVPFDAKSLNTLTYSCSFSG